MTHKEIAKIPQEKIVTYARVVPDYHPQKNNPYRIRITADGNLIRTNMELTTRTAEMLTAKLMWNSMISMPGARYAGFDIKNFYLGTPMNEYEYMKMPLKMFPEHVRKQYNLMEHVKNRYVYLKIQRAIYGLPQVGRLANLQLKKVYSQRDTTRWNTRWDCGRTRRALLVSRAVLPVTGKHITNYMKSKKDPAITDVWSRAFGKEFGGLAQGDDLTGEKGTNTVVVMTHKEIA